MPCVCISHGEKRILNYCTAEAKCVYIVQPNIMKYFLQMDKLLHIQQTPYSTEILEGKSVEVI